VTGLDASIAAPRTAAGSIRTVVGDALSVFALAGRVLRQHWPVLLAIALAGQILREGALRVGALVAYYYGPWRWFVFALAPALFSLTLVLMLLRARSSLPSLPPRTGSLWAQAAALTIPFLVFYQQAGYLQTDEDLSREFTEDVVTSAANPMANLLAPLWTALPVGVAIVGIRWILGRLPAVKRHPTLNLPAIYLEVLFILFSIKTIAIPIEKAQAWVPQRRAWVGLIDWMHSDFAWAGPGGSLLRPLFGWWNSVSPTVHSGLIIPLLAITTGAVVYGVKIEREPRPARHRAGGTVAVAARTLGSLAWRPIDSRLRPALQGLRVMLSVGVVATLAFCLGYVALNAVDTWSLAWERALIGPQDLNLFWRPGARMLRTFDIAVIEVLVVCLIAGGVGRVAQRIDPSGDAQAQEPRLEGDHLDPDRGGLGVGR
jgi:hypothetical protein